MLEGSFASAMVLRIPVRSLPRSSPDGSDVHVDDALNLIVIDFGGGLKIHQLHHRIESGGTFQIGRAQRDLLQVDQVVDGGFAVLGVLHAQEIVVAGFDNPPSSWARS